MRLSEGHFTIEVIIEAIIEDRNILCICIKFYENIRYMSFRPP